MSHSGLDIPPEPAALTTTPPLRGTGHHCLRAPHGRARDLRRPRIPEIGI